MNVIVFSHLWPIVIVDSLRLDFNPPIHARVNLIIVKRTMTPMIAIIRNHVINANLNARNAALHAHRLAPIHALNAPIWVARASPLLRRMSQMVLSLLQEDFTLWTTISSLTLLDLFLHAALPLPLTLTMFVSMVAATHSANSAKVTLLFVM